MPLRANWLPSNGWSANKCHADSNFAFECIYNHHSESSPVKRLLLNLKMSNEAFGI